jgi:hypothetical protein
MYRFIALIAAALTCLFAATAFAQIDYDTDPVYEAARADAQAGRYDAAFPVIKRAAEDGYAPAQYNLAQLYRDGLGTLPSQGMYRKWVEAAAAQEYSLALYTLGLDYDFGRGVAKDLPRALAYYERGAFAGDTMAAYNAGQLNLMGEGAIPANKLKAIRFLEMSAAGNEQPALMTLGYMYEAGFSAKHDVNLSKDYYYRAEAAGAPGAAEAIDRLKKVASRAAFDKLLANDHAGAFAAFRQLCEEEDMEACAYYGNYLANGAPGVAGSFPDALPPLKKSCDAGDMYGCKFLAYTVVRGKRFGDEDTRYKAASYFAKKCGSAFRPDQEACYNLAVMYYNHTIKGGHEKAREVAAEACAAKYSDACRMVTEIDARAASAARQTEEDARRAAEFAARPQGSYSAGVPSSYSSASSSSYTSSSSTQDTADFNAFINKVNSIGTGYSASCRSGNPYC